MSTFEEQQLAAAVGELRGVAAANRICHACVDLLDVDAAAISMVFDGAKAATLGASSALARTLDEVQFTVGEGPCLDCVTERAPIVITDLADPTEVRWPMYRPLMLAHHIHGVSALPIMITGHGVGALNLFQLSPDRLHPQQLDAARVAADLAQLPLLDLLDEHLRHAATDPEGTAWTELHALTRYEVAQATGMVMAQLDVGASEALVRLRAHAYATDTGATQIARAIIGRHLRLDQP